MSARKPESFNKKGIFKKHRAKSYKMQIVLDLKLVSKAIRNAQAVVSLQKALLKVFRPPMVGYLDARQILNSDARSSEPSLASFSLPRCKTFGLSVTVISTAFPRLAQSRAPEGKVWYPPWPLGEK